MNAGGGTGRERGGRTAGRPRVLRRIWDSATLKVLLICSTTALALWILWGPRLAHAELFPEFGDLGEWVQGIGAFVAVLVALAQSRQMQVMRAEDIHLQEERARTQVYAWVAYNRGADMGGGWRVYLHNMTPAPIAVWALRIADQAGREIAFLDATTGLPILPGRTERPLEGDTSTLISVDTRLEFVDETGLCWRRDVVGGLTPVTEVRGRAGVLATARRPEQR